MSADHGRLMCPSAQPDMNDCEVLGVVSGTPERPRTAYVTERLPVTADVLRLADPVPPTAVFRLAARCEESKCAHFDGAHCRLATRIVNMLPAVVRLLPPCRLRHSCRWYDQEGAPACLRCPQIVTTTRDTSEELRRVAKPEAVARKAGDGHIDA